MEDNTGFNDQLFQAILERQQAFDSVLLPKLLEEYRITQSAVRAVLNVLLKKGVIHDDPYKYDSKVSEIQVPDDSSFTDGEKSSVIGRRFSQYEAMLDYMGNYYQFSCDFLTTERINLLVAFGKSFMWENFSTTSNKPNTKGLADLVNMIRTGGDSLSVSIINDAINQLSRSSATIMKTLKNLTEFHRERYKTAIRKIVLPEVTIDEKTVASGYSEAIRIIKKAFAVSMKGQPFYTELIEEILKEDFSPEKETLRNELLSRLAIVKATTKQEVKQTALKPVLLDGIRTLGSISPQIDEIANKLLENHRIVQSVKKGAFQKLVAALRKAFNVAEAKHEVVITVVDPTTQTGKRETIDFGPFIDELRHRSRLCTGFAMRSSPSYQRIEAMPEQQILDLLTRQIAEINGLMKQCGGFDEYYKQTAPLEVHDRIKGIRVEISTIKNGLVKANQSRAEYSAQVEEQQQLKKLGITNV